MDRSRSSFTVLFQDPFWVGVAERWDGAGYRAAKVTFGAQPTDAEILQWLEHEWHRLRFSPPQRAEETARLGHQNPKRARREARRAAANAGIGTKAQQSLGRQREQRARDRQAQCRERRQDAEERKFLLRQQKKREKRRGR